MFSLQKYSNFLRHKLGFTWKQLCNSDGLYKGTKEMYSEFVF